MTDSTVAERIEDIDVSQEMESSFLEYAYSVIYARALPDARDGMKPVQRRILYIMDEMGLAPDKGHVKSGRVVGDVMGKLHPHGDSSIYDALVRLAQPFAMRLPLVDGHGNFGSLDDGPAAYRYTEARLAPAAQAMVESLDEDVVEFVPNYDNQIMQPEVLPAAIPNLIVNGAAGIAVGMATNMAPHNLVEVIEGAKHLLEHPEASVSDVMRFIPGPDLPTGGTIVGLDGVKEAYETGRGSFKTRAKVKIEQITARKTGLIVTELPYMVGPERVIEKIKQGVEAKKITGISDVTDLTDRKNGLRLVISLKTGYSAEAVLEQLYRLTPLEDSFAINAVALVDGKPQTLGLRELLRVFLDHRLDVVTRRSRFRLKKKQDRLHLVDGLLIAILDIDEVIQLIRTSDDAESARARLMQVFDLSRAQAEYILELRLRRLTKFSRVELEAEQDQLRREIEALEEILGSPERLRQVVSQELDEAAAAYGTPRRTVLTGAAPAAKQSGRAKAASLEVADSPSTVLLSTTGRALRVDRSDGGYDEPLGGRATKHGAVLARLDTTARSEIGAVLSTGVLHRFSPVDLPVVPAASVAFSAGVSLTQYLGISDRSTQVVGLVSLTEEAPVALFTRNGVVKRILVNELPVKPELEIIGLKNKDTVVSAFAAPNDSEFAVVASDAQLLRFATDLVRPQGPGAGGMAGITLKGDATVIFACCVAKDADASVVTVADSSDALPGADIATAKLSAWSEFPAKGRATGGVRSHRFHKGESRLAAAWVGTGTPRALAKDGSARELPTEFGRRDGGGTATNGAIATVGSIPL